MSVIEDVLKGYEIVDLAITFEERMPMSQIPFAKVEWKSHKKGDEWSTSMLIMWEHHGTHVDAPAHFTGKDGYWIDQIPLESWMGACCVLHFTEKQDNEEVTVEDIKKWEKQYGEIKKGDIVIFDYGWIKKKWKVPIGIEDQPYYKNNPGLSLDAANYLIDKGIKLIGQDAATVNPYIVTSPISAEEPVLSNNILVCEGLMNLEKLPPRGAYFIALPLKVKGGSGCPVRAIALCPK